MFLTVDAVKPVGSLNARNIKRVRYCIGAVTNGRASLIKQQQSWQAANPDPMPSTAGCPNASWGNSVEVAQDIVNTAQATSRAGVHLPAELRAARFHHRDQRGLHGRLESGQVAGRDRAHVRRLPRNQNRAPVAKCSAQYAGTGKKIALNGSASEDPEGFNLKEYKWYADGQTPTRRPRRASSHCGTRPPPARTRSG